MLDSVVAATPAARRATIRERQRDLYGTSLRSLVHGLAEDYGVSQARLAGVIGISAAMHSQLVSADRIKIGDPLANTRLMILAQRRTLVRRLTDPSKVDEVLADVARIQQPWPWPWPWPWHRVKQDGRTAPPSTTDLRSAATPQQLTSAANRLQAEFPQLAQVLRQAADA